jgi:hypothetical protein
MTLRSVLLACACLLGGSISAKPLSVDLELVLAVDVSYSMDLDEQRLQRQGYVAAFLEPELIEAIENGPLGRIAVTYVEWGGAAPTIPASRRRSRAIPPSPAASSSMACRSC